MSHIPLGRGIALWSATMLLALLAAGWAPAARAEESWSISFGRATQGSGTAATEARAVSGFQAIAAAGPVKLVVRQAAREALELRADDNLLPLIETVVEGGTLRIAPKRGESLRPRSPIIATVDVVNLKSLSLSGSGDVVVETLKTPSLELRLTGSSDARLHKLTTDELGVRVSGSGDVEAAGSATRLKASIAGSGNVRTKDLAADDVTISIAGSGDASVTANKTLSVTIAGSGDVVYGGSGALVKSSVTGSGSVRQQR
jgi:Putative auto-transporter adhesin, head GIN domain